MRTYHRLRGARAPRRLGPWLAATMLGLGCQSAPAAKPSPPAVSAGELRARTPDAVTPAPSGRVDLGGLAEVTTPAREKPVRPSAMEVTPALAPLIEVAGDAESAPYALRAGALVLPGGLTIDRVPVGIAVRALRERGSGDDVWEIIDAQGLRQALLKARSWSRAMNADSLAESAPIRAAALDAAWNGHDVPVLVDRFQHSRHIYTIERRAQGTEWIWRGLELTQ